MRVTNSRNIQQDTWHWHAVCQQTHERFHLTLGETFSKSTSLKMMKKDDKSAQMEISQVFGTFDRLTVKALSETMLFREWSDEVFHSL